MPEIPAPASPPSPQGAGPVRPLDRTEATEQRARIELVRMAYLELKSGTAASSACAVAFAAAVAYTHENYLACSLWLGAILIFASIRLWLAHSFDKLPPAQL